MNRTLHPETIHWQLRYSDGLVIEEPREGGSILLAYANPLELAVLGRDGSEIHRIDLMSGGGGWRAIWYRERSQALSAGPTRISLGGGFHATAPNLAAQSRTDATVYGRARVKPRGLGLDATLWALVGQKIIDCPQELFRKADIERIVSWPQTERKLII